MRSPKLPFEARNSTIRSPRWKRLTTSSVTPADVRRRITRSIIGAPPTSSRAFGVLSVSGRSRLPTPAARIIAFIAASPSCARWRTSTFTGNCSRRCCRQPLGAVDRAVLAAGAAEGDDEVGEVARLVVLDGLVDQREDVAEEVAHGGLALEERDHGIVAARQLRVLLEPAGVGQRPAVEHVAAAVSLLVGRHAVLVREALDPHRELQRGGAELPQGGGRDQAAPDLRQLGQLDGKVGRPQQVLEVPDRVRDAGQEVLLPLVEASQAVGAHRLHDPDVDEAGVVGSGRPCGRSARASRRLRGTARGARRGPRTGGRPWRRTAATRCRTAAPRAARPGSR